MTETHTPEQNSLMYWWNELLFTRYFEYKTTIELSVLENAIQAYDYENIGFMWGTLQETNIKYHANGKGITFDIQRKMRRKMDFISISTARAQGDVIVDSATGHLIVSGTVKFGRFFHFYLLFGVLNFLLAMVFILPLMREMGVYAMSVMAFIFLGIAVISPYWWIIYKHRNDIAEQIEEAIIRA